MSESAPGGRDLAQLVFAAYDVPAFIRRAREVTKAYDDLLVAVGKQRAKWLPPVGEALEEVLHRAGSWPGAAVHLHNGDVLPELAGIVPPRPLPEHPPVAAWRVRRSLGDLVHAIDRFNAAWGDYLAKLDLAGINALRDGYNRYYVLEKECAVHNVAVANAGFRPLPPLTVADVRGLFPPLPVPRLT